MEQQQPTRPSVQETATKMLREFEPTTPRPPAPKMEAWMVRRIDGMDWVPMTMYARALLGQK